MTSRKPESKSYKVIIKPQNQKELQIQELAKKQNAISKRKVKGKNSKLLKIKSKTKKSEIHNENDNNQNKEVENKNKIKIVKFKDPHEQIEEKPESVLALPSGAFKINRTNSGECRIPANGVKKSKAFSRSSGSGPLSQSLKHVPFNQDKTIFQLHSKPTFTYNNGIIEQLPLASDEIKWAHKIRLAITEGGSPNPRENKYLKKLILKSVDENFPWQSLQEILKNCGVPQKISDKCFLIQLGFQTNIDVICCVRTNNIVALKKSMLPLLKDYKASFKSVIHNFKHCCYIEALASYRTPINFVNFEKQLGKDAMDCKAKAVEIIDYETGAVHFECHPLQLADVVQQLEEKHYRVLYSDYGLSSLKKVQLTEDKRKYYKNFLCKLLSMKEIEKIVDNLEESSDVDADNEKDNVKKFENN